MIWMFVSFLTQRTSHMRTRLALFAGATLLATGAGFAAATAWSAESSASADQRLAASAPQKLAATSMVVYKSRT